MQKQWFSFGFSRLFITLQKCIRRRFATHFGGPKLSFGASFGCPKRPMDPNLEARSLPRTPTWTPKELPDLQVGGPKPFQNSNMEAQSGPRRQLGGQRRSKTPFWRSGAFQHLNFEAPKRSFWQPKPSSEEQNFEELNL